MLDIIVHFYSLHLNLLIWMASKYCQLQEDHLKYEIGLVVFLARKLHN